MSPSPRAAVGFAAVALGGLVAPIEVVLLVALILAAAVVVDALAARRPPIVGRRVPAVLARGVPAPLLVEAEPAGATAVRTRQPLVPDVDVVPGEGGPRLDAGIVAHRRGRHALPPVAVRATGPLGLGRWDHRGGGEAELRVYPDLPAARRIALQVRQGRFRDPGRRRRGPLGLGTDFESVREYSADDDVRSINWTATARLGRPMSNQYREDTERDVVCLIDAGRLMAAPVGDGTRLDLALDAVAAVGAVADVVGDRCGVIAFADVVQRRLVPRRANADAVVRALYDLEPTGVDSDYHAAFADIGTTKRALVLVLTDLLEEAAARPLLAATPTVARGHAVVVASVADPDLLALLGEPSSPRQVYAAAVATEVLEARARVAHQLARTGATVLEARPDELAAACVGAYLGLRARARL
jgi:uncharacterized protein (DUF58 family)